MARATQIGILGVRLVIDVTPYQFVGNPPVPTAAAIRALLEQKLYGLESIEVTREKLLATTLIPDDLDSSAYRLIRSNLREVVTSAWEAAGGPLRDSHEN